MKLSKASSALVILTALYCIALIVSNVIAGKLWQTPIPSIVLTPGVFLFPIVYIIGDVIPELFGLQIARTTIWIGFLGNLIAVAFFMLTLILPYPVFWQNQAAFEAVLGFTPRLLAASFLAFLVGSHLNAWVLDLIHKTTGNKFLWVRTISSTVVGESIDSLIFISVAFFGTMPNEVLFGMILAQATFKISYEVLATPLTYLVVNKLRPIISSL